jgi:hypothetical protein
MTDYKFDLGQGGTQKKSRAQGQPKSDKKTEDYGFRLD